MVGFGALEPPQCDWPSLTACCSLQLVRGKVRPLVGTCRDRRARVAAGRGPGLRLHLAASPQRCYQGGRCGPSSRHPASRSQGNTHLASTSSLP